ncbi:YpfN family protein [Zophobihabitans entericus]|uniref:YpfN family protein n=1 Tax=Zophobihabitans entericus TaxID=1635327 RepID=A0A6G9ICI5_9GAMM|nr:YpfN family protein [Zophobihabitans entericus]QIQ21933.1 YpfN family protein [Zophobihabitans entericus]
MEWLKEYWWIIIPLLLLGVILNGIKDLKKLSFKEYLEKKKGIKPIPYDDDEEDDWKKK